MANERLRTAMIAAGVSAAELGRSCGVDAKTVSRWMAGRLPHRRNRMAAATYLSATEQDLWPQARPDLAPTASAAVEIAAAWGRRSNVPTELWAALLLGARERIDVLAYTGHWLWECDPRLPSSITEHHVQVRVALIDPDCDHVDERDALEQLGGTFRGRVKDALGRGQHIWRLPTVQLGLHRSHLYNTIVRADDQMIVTPYMIRRRGYEHPALHLRKHSPHGLFETFALEFEDVWATCHPQEGD
ncbi:MAG: XRE family transcriptional regulator [Streptosporangiales bacterium]|nr:XRE family transcriptional regulator [Streptosporangiales bacterium]